jgi:hypothetical protein
MRPGLWRQLLLAALCAGGAAGGGPEPSHCTFRGPWRAGAAVDLARPFGTSLAREAAALEQWAAETMGCNTSALELRWSAERGLHAVARRALAARERNLWCPAAIRLDSSVALATPLLGDILRLAASNWSGASGALEPASRERLSGIADLPARLAAEQGGLRGRASAELFLHFEAFLNARSRFAPYLAALPTSIEHLPAHLCVPSETVAAAPPPHELPRCFRASGAREMLELEPSLRVDESAPYRAGFVMAMVEDVVCRFPGVYGAVGGCALQGASAPPRDAARARVEAELLWSSVMFTTRAYGAMPGRFAGFEPIFDALNHDADEQSINYASNHDPTQTGAKAKERGEELFNAYKGRGDPGACSVHMLNHYGFVPRQHASEDCETVTLSGEVDLPAGAAVSPVERERETAPLATAAKWGARVSALRTIPNVTLAVVADGAKLRWTAAVVVMRGEPVPPVALAVNRAVALELKDLVDCSARSAQPEACDLSMRAISLENEQRAVAQLQRGVQNLLATRLQRAVQWRDKGWLHPALVDDKGESTSDAAGRCVPPSSLAEHHMQNVLQLHNAAVRAERHLLGQVQEAWAGLAR